MTEAQKRELDKLLSEPKKRQVRFVDYAQATFNEELHEWQRNHLCPILDEWAHAKGMWLLMHGPPQVGKSMFGSVRLPSYVLGTDPMAKVFLATNSIETSVEFGEAVRNLCADEDHHRFFPDGRSWVDPASSAKRFKTPARLAVTDSQPSFQALGLLSRFIGKGPTHLIIDDPYSSPEAAASPAINEKTWRFWTRAAIPRLGPDCNVLVFFHSYHVDDLAARMAKDKRFRKVRFPIVADDNEDGCDPTGRAPGEPLSPLRPKQWCVQWQSDDPEGFAAMGQGKPIVEGDALINPAWFETIAWEDAPELRFYHRGYDLALKDKKENDETATAIGGLDEDLNLYVYEMAAWRRDTPKSMEKVEEYALTDPKATFIVFFDEVVQLAVIQQLAYQDHLNINEVPREGNNKYASAVAWIRRAKQRRVFLVLPPKEGTDTRNSYKPVPQDTTGEWIAKFKNQCLYFRNKPTDKDDWIDALSAVYNHAYKHAGSTRKDKPAPKVGTAAYYRELAKRQ